jgi:hypothetical protein
MLGSPHLSPSNGRHIRRPPQSLVLDRGYYYESGGLRTPSIEDFKDLNLAHHTHQSYPFTRPNPHASSSASADLPSRIAALNRRAAIVSANLAHLTAVVKPLESTKPEKLSQNDLHGMHQEGVGLVEAMGAFEEQMAEVLGILARLVREKRRSGETAGIEEEWEFGRGRKRIL